ncbi:SDR family NAD(P)-dependent oxidoreductase [Orrella daihaiensis]|uniref:SDR family NAD(P)-dependent oxidoreductase n=1 Tax=Orrella daihaiensis TaxID=2782176 RepID=A0ABY4AHK8_9BURK|nr:SDR family NAD(P)-dependent oxidoreductase [Orrella daihaiensis]UOD49771.1 SDR family NAD(P)-dependent oxidoreductase [Orrella daihaiensis]
MQSLGRDFRALVIGAHGTIGTALAEQLRADPNCAHVATISRATHPYFALESETGIEQAATEIAGEGPFALIIDATGALTIDGNGPEKHLGALNAERLARAFEVNAIGPALIIKHFSSLLTKDRSIFAKLSARVGSISDNHKGGWYGYRAAKAAVNMLLQTAAIELQRRRPDTIVVALQPGTVQSPLSAPFSRGHDTVSPEESAVGLLQAMDELQIKSGAQFVDYKGQPIPW